jgi:hypothetical protein
MKGFEPALAFRNFVHLKASAAYLVLLTVAYLVFRPVGGHDGGTWFGYAVGTQSAALTVWLVWLGVRKRSYRKPRWTMRAWVSGHVYWGLTLLWTVPLHAGFQFHWNVHTLAYALMVAVILSGVWGVWLYSRVPERMTENRPVGKLQALLQEIADIDSQWIAAARELPDYVAAATRMGVEETRIGGGLWRQLSGRDPRCGTARALDMLQGGAKGETAAERDRVGDLTELVSRKLVLLARVRRELRYKALLDLWLVFHVPAALAATLAVAIHVFLVFYYR